MKRIWRIFCLLAAAALFSVAALAADTAAVRLYAADTGQYEETTVGTASLELDGEAVETDVDPFILDGRTLVPVRVISENLGADVSWDAATQQVTITTEEKIIVLTIGSSMALVDGEETELPDGVAASLVQVEGGSRTMVPVRFISEQLGADVQWDADSRTVIITSAASAEPAGTVLSITAQEDQIRIETDGAADFALTELDGRLVLDLPGMELDGDVIGWTGQLDLTGLAASDVRYSQYDTGYDGYDRVVRLVFDLKDGAAASDIALEWDGDTLVCTLPAMDDPVAESESESGSESASESEIESESGPESESAYGDTAVSQVLSSVSATVLPSDLLPSDDDSLISGELDGSGEAAESTHVPDYADDIPEVTILSDYDPTQVSILLDAGHGGSDPGCQYYDTDEKDLTLAMTFRLGSILESMGYQVLYTRTDDSYVSLTDRTDMANTLGVTVFVSIHVNAYDDTEINGTETYYWTLGTAEEQQLATLVQEAVIDATGANDRGVKTANYWVTRATDMPAILVETGYLSNETEWENLTSADYQDRLAQGLADGIAAWLALQQ